MFALKAWPQFTHRQVQILKSQVCLKDWPVTKYAEKIGFGFAEYASKFENLKEVINSDGSHLKSKDMPADLRRYVLMMNERLRRGVLTFEYLELDQTEAPPFKI